MYNIAMKLKSILLALLVVPFLARCSSNSNENNRLTYGTYLHEESVEIHCDQLVSKMQKENFLVAVHPEKGSCSCWTNFEIVLNVVTKKSNLLCYKILYSEINDELYDSGNGFLRLSDKPSFYIVSNNKILKRFIYPSSSISDEDSNLFFNENTFVKVINKYIAAPVLYQVGIAKLAEIAQGDAIVYYMRESCSDCSYCTPNLLMKYFGSDKKFNNKIYVLDLDPYYNTDAYQSIKDGLGLSTVNNPTYGYGNGVVPTFQVIKNGKIDDMCVYFNETIVKNAEGNYVISESYYSKNRVANLKYTDTVLDGTIIPQNEIIEYPEYNYIGIKNSQYHGSLYDPILTSFLDMYLQ